MTSRLRIAVAAGAAAAVAALPLSAQAAPTKLSAVVGPGFTITLKKGTTKVTRLKPGQYTFVVQDKSNIHNFHLKGPGVDKKFAAKGVANSISWKGTVSVTLTLKKGKYTFVCDPHPTMKGAFIVA